MFFPRACFLVSHKNLVIFADPHILKRVRWSYVNWVFSDTLVIGLVPHILRADLRVFLLWKQLLLVIHPEDDSNIRNFPKLGQSTVRLLFVDSDLFVPVGANSIAPDARTSCPQQASPNSHLDEGVLIERICVDHQIWAELFRIHPKVF